MLFNLWATWCVPCRKEMPALDELQAKLGGADFEVVAVNIDTRDADKPRAWLKEVGIERLAYYADPAAKVFQDLKQVGKAWGMPTTILVDAAGCEIGTLAGPAEWASDDAIKLVNAALGRAQTELDRNIEVSADAGGDVGETVDVFLRGLDHLHDRLGGVRIHPQHLRSERHLNFRGLGADECRRKRSHVHRLHSSTRHTRLTPSFARPQAIDRRLLRIRDQPGRVVVLRGGKSY